MPTVILTTYYDPFPDTYTTCSDIPALAFLHYEVDWMHEKLGQLNAVINGFDTEFSNVTVVDLEGAMDGHKFCSSDPWVYGPSIPAPGADPTSPAPFHPTSRGQERIAELIAQALS
jgi:hypothetical protein